MTASQISAAFLWTDWGSFSRWEWAEIVSAVFVSLGCIGEMWWLFRKGPPKESFTIWQAFESKRHSRERLYAILVAVGVSAEVVTLLHSLKESGGLRLEVGQLQQTNGWIWQTNFLLQSNISGLNLLVSSNALLTAKANERAAEVEMAAAELNRQAASRGLTPEQDRALVRELAKSPSNGVTIVSEIGDRESSDFADDFEAAFVRARWKVSRTEWQSMKVRPFLNQVLDEPEPKNWPKERFGDWLTYSASTTSREFFLPQKLSGVLAAHNSTNPCAPASAIISAFGKVEGLLFTDLTAPDVPPGIALLLIAPKPSVGLRSILPRAFHPSVDDSNGLAKFAWTNTVIVSDPLDTFDAKSLSEQIGAVLKGATTLGTNPPAWARGGTPFREGVSVEATLSSESARRAGYTDEARLALWHNIVEQRMALVDVLNGATIEAEMGWLDPSAPFGWIVIRVGPSPGKEAVRRHQEMEFHRLRFFQTNHPNALTK